MYHSWKVLLQLRESAVAWWNGHLKTHPRWFEWATHISADLSKVMFTRLLCSTISKLFPIVTTLPVEIHLQKQFNFFQMNAPSHNDYLWNCCLYCFPLCNIVSRQDWGKKKSWEQNKIEQKQTNKQTKNAWGFGMLAVISLTVFKMLLTQITVTPTLLLVDITMVIKFRGKKREKGPFKFLILIVCSKDCCWVWFN